MVERNWGDPLTSNFSLMSLGDCRAWKILQAGYSVIVDTTLAVLNAPRKNQELPDSDEKSHIIRLDSKAINDPSAASRRGL